ncbi:uncharacterized protein LOC113385205 [Ctenocephalides felis]|uniref:uncharacterized protein LOC113385205 n=1 Tax=Ctenocephalides felis TaxID=7515 RepID=UPI000E6E4A79|nr:uncharacterized protein LOC113385205 [Ctenocephalides felis]XP_026478817.1 uncharacterized protein LOC113385205 [Ctenocephalides felis]
MGRKCIVSTCTNTRKHALLHRFPLYANVREEWLRRIGNPELLAMSHGQIDAKRLCTEHFSETCRFPGSWRKSNLKLGSLPTINMPGFSGDPLAKENCLMEVTHLTYKLKKTKECLVNQEPSQHTENIPAPAPILLAESTAATKIAKSTMEMSVPVKLTAPSTTSIIKSKIQYRCAKCKITFIFKSEILKHVQQEHINTINKTKNKLKYGCRLCSKKFAYKESVRYHILSEHKENLQPLFKTNRDANDSIFEEQSKCKQNIVDNTCLSTLFEPSEVRISPSSSSSKAHNINIKKVTIGELPNIETLNPNISGILLNQQNALVSDLTQLTDALQNYQLSSDIIKIVSHKLKPILALVKMGIENK